MVHAAKSRAAWTPWARSLSGGCRAPRRRRRSGGADRVQTSARSKPIPKCRDRRIRGGTALRDSCVDACVVFRAALRRWPCCGDSVPLDRRHVLSDVEGPALSDVEGPALSDVEGARPERRRRGRGVLSIRRGTPRIQERLILVLTGEVSNLRRPCLRQRTPRRRQRRGFS